MKLSTRARYSIRLMIYLGDYASREKPAGLKEVADNQGLSMRYLEHLVVPLKNASLIRSVAGKSGGYFLARNPKDITAREIVETAIGPIQLMDCLDFSYHCQFMSVCPSRKMWSQINEQMVSTLTGHTLKDLSEMKIMASMQGEGNRLSPCQSKELTYGSEIDEQS